MSISIRQIELTPELAAKYLSAVGANRPIRDSRVEFIAHQIENGLWKEGVSGIAFDVNGEMIDGQRRCSAVLKCGIPIKIYVKRGLEPDSKAVFDTGQPRSFADVLHMKGYSYWTNLAASVRMLALYQLNSTFTVGKISAAHLNVFHLMDLLENNKGLVESMAYVHSTLGKALVGFFPVSRAAGFHYLFSQAGGQDTATEFVNSLALGVNIKDGECMAKLRYKLDRQARNPGGPRLGRRVTHALVIKTWNATVTGEHPKTLGWYPAPPRNEAFPEIHGAENILL